MLEGEDGKSKFVEEIEQKCIEKRRQKKRKIYLGPDSTDGIPRSSRYRFKIDDLCFKNSAVSCEVPGASSQSQYDSVPQAALRVTEENQVCVGYVGVENAAPESQMNVSHYQVNSLCDQSTSFLNQISLPGIVASCTVSKHSAGTEVLDRGGSVSRPDSSRDSNHSQDILTFIEADRNQGVCSVNSQGNDNGSETEAFSDTTGSHSQQSSQHETRSSSRTSTGSRSTSPSSLSLLDSESESESEDEQPVNGHDAQGDEERGRDQEQGPHDHPREEAGGREGEAREQEQAPQDGDAQEEMGDRQRNRQPTHGKLREAIQGGFLNNLEVPVEASRSDILYMALSYASKNNETNTSFHNLINLINCIFATPILPTSQHLLDKLLVSDVGVHYHFFCKKCFKSFGEVVDYKNIKFKICDICGIQNHISDLRISTFFVILDLPVQLEVLFSKPELIAALSTPTEAVQRSRAGHVTDVYDGSMYHEFCASTANFDEKILSMHLSVDGSPIAKSSSSSIWPIQGLIHELSTDLRTKHLLLCGLWFGKTHPVMSLFLSPFVSHMRTLGEGFQLQAGPNLWNTRLFCIGCCVDSGARGSVQGIKTHGGYYSCNWCHMCGVYINNAVRYPLDNRRPQERTHDELVMIQRRLVDRAAARAGPMADEEEEEEEENNEGPRNADMLGVISVSPLINLPLFSMVNGFFVDTMHCVDMGVVKAQLSIWLEEAGMPYYLKRYLPELNRRILALRPPLEFRRMPRILKERLNFKAREYNNFLFYSYIILKSLLPGRYLNTWVLLVQAIFLLSQTDVSIQQIDIAETLIIHFLAGVQFEYGERNMSFNLHILRHLPAHTRRWGPVWASSAYVFEDGNGHLKNLIHTVQCVPQQVVRHWSWDLAKNILHPHVSDKARNYASTIAKPKHQNKISYRTRTCRLIGRPSLANLSEEEIFLIEENQQLTQNLQSFQKLIFNNCAYTVESKKCARTCNSVAQLSDKSVVLIRRILYDSDNDNVFLLVSDVNWDPIMTPPQGVHLDRDDHCLREVQFINEEIRFIKCTDLKTVCFRTKMPHCDLLSVLPNIYNRH